MYFHHLQLEGVEFIYDSHGQTFLSTLYISILGEVEKKDIRWLGDLSNRKDIQRRVLVHDRGSITKTKRQSTKQITSVKESTGFRSILRCLSSVYKLWGTCSSLVEENPFQSFGFSVGLGLSCFFDLFAFFARTISFFRTKRCIGQRESFWKLVYIGDVSPTSTIFYPKIAILSQF